MSDTNPILYCANHPHVETGLRCNQCDKPICAHCAKKTPTGYRCTECIKVQQKIFDNAQWQDFIFAAVIGFSLSLLGGWLVTFLSRLVALIAGILVILLTPTYGIAIAELIRRVVNRRRSRTLFQITAVSVAIGSLPFLLITIIPILFGSLGFGSLFRLAWQVIYAFTITSTVYYRLRGINI